MAWPAATVAPIADRLGDDDAVDRRLNVDRVSPSAEEAHLGLAVLAHADLRRQRDLGDHVALVHALPMLGMMDSTRPAFIAPTWTGWPVS